MKTRFVLGFSSVCLAALALGACGSTSTKGNASSTVDPKEMQEKWMAFATPGKEHHLLDSDVGNWTGTVKMFPAPGAPADTSTMTSEVKWVMDGRYVVDHSEGSFAGQPFHGMGTTGYDNMKKKYVGTWIDSMGTGVMVSEGDYDASTKTFNFTSETPDVMTGKYVKSRMTVKYTDHDHRTMKMFGPGPDGKEFMMMQIDYTRQK